MHGAKSPLEAVIPQEGRAMKVVDASCSRTVRSIKSLGITSHPSSVSGTRKMARVPPVQELHLRPSVARTGHDDVVGGRRTDVIG